MYEELVKNLRKMQSVDYCAIASAEDFPAMQIIQEAADAIEKLSKRETPMRVRRTTSTTRCPSCNKQLSGRGNTHRNYRFCRWCGQALDWTEPPKEDE